MRNLMVPSRIRFCCATTGAPSLRFIDKEAEMQSTQLAKGNARSSSNRALPITELSIENCMSSPDEVSVPGVETLAL